MKRSAGPVRVKPFVCLLCGKAVSQPTLVGRGAQASVAHEFGQALHFYMPGNWASGIWDSTPSVRLTESRLEGAICDGCLRPLLKRVRVVRYREEYREVSCVTYTEWDKEQKRLMRERREHERRVARGEKRCSAKRT